MNLKSKCRKHVETIFAWFPGVVCLGVGVSSCQIYVTYSHVAAKEIRKNQLEDKNMKELKSLRRRDIISPYLSLIFIVDFETLKLSIPLRVCSSFSRSTKVYFDQVRSKERRKNYLDDYSVRSDKIFCRFYDFTALFFLIKYCYTHFLFVCKVYIGIFSLGMKRKEGKTSQIVLASGPTTDAILNYVFVPPPRYLKSDNSRILLTEAIFRMD